MENNKGIDNHYKNNCWTVAQTLESGGKKESYYHSSNHKKAGSLTVSANFNKCKDA